MRRKRGKRKGEKRENRNLVKDVISQQLEEITVICLRPTWIHIKPGLGGGQMRKAGRGKEKRGKEKRGKAYSGLSLIKPSFVTNRNSRPFSASFANSASNTSV